MKAVFFAADKDRERRLAEALADGLRVHGDRLKVRGAGPPWTLDADVVCAFGVKSQDLLHRCWRHGVHSVLFDKGYTRGTRHLRAAVDSIHPLDAFQVGRPPNRWESLGIDLRPRSQGQRIIFAGSSAKFHRAVKLPEPTDYAEQVVRKLRHRTTREIVYRPKPSWRDAEPVDGATFQQGGTLAALLSDAHLLATWGSSAAVDAIIAGVPVLALGETIARPVAETSIKRVEAPFFPNDEQRHQWACDLAYCQWSLDELRSGEAWQHIRPVIWPALVA